MSGNVSKQANRINIKNPVFAILTTDTKDSISYGEVTSLGDAMQVQVTPTLSAGTLYGNGMQKENISKIVGIALVLDVNKVPIENRAKILGHTYASGILHVKPGDQAPYMAVGYEVDETNGATEYTWLFKGRAQPFNGTVQQSTENINFSTDSITINFIAREYDGELYQIADTANADFSQEDWMTSVPGATGG